MRFHGERIRAGHLVIMGFRRAAMVGGLLCLGATGAAAQKLTLSGSPAAMNITTAVAGANPTAVTNAVTTYTVRTNAITSPKKITVALNTAMPAGMTVTVTLVAPTGATSSGAVALDATARDVVINITNTANQTKSITYVISATPAAGVVTSTTRTVTFTLATYP